jgi:hypothetical protein
VGTDGKELITAASQNYFFAIDLPRYHVLFAEIPNWQSILQIGFSRLWCPWHNLPPDSP